MPSNLVTLYEDADFNIEIETAYSARFVHVAVGRWSPSVARRFDAVIAEQFAKLSGPVLAAHFPHQGTKHIKFITRAGFTPFGPSTYRGSPCEIYIKVN